MNSKRGRPTRTQQIAEGRDPFPNREAITAKPKDVKNVVSTIGQRVGKIARNNSFEELPLSTRIQHVSELMAEQIFESTIALSTIKAREIAVDPNIEHFFKTNLSYTKEMLSLATKLNDFASKQRHVEETSAVVDVTQSDEALELLSKARQTLALVGGTDAPAFEDAEVIEDAGDDDASA